MPITKVNGVITETAPTQGDRFNRTAVHIDSDFALCDESDVLKQMKFDVSPMSAGKSITFQAGAGSADITLTLPSASGSLSTTNINLQYSVPTNGGTATISGSSGLIYYVLNPAATLTNGFTATFPTAPANGTVVHVSTTAAINNAIPIVAPGGSDTISFVPNFGSTNTCASWVYVASVTKWFLTSFSQP